MDYPSPDRLGHPDRLAALERLGLLDAPPTPDLDRWTRLASRLLHAPVVQITLVDATRQFVVSQIGLSEPLASDRQMPLSHSFCQYVVLGAAPLVVDDARRHPLVANNPAITDHRVIAYLGIPLTSSDGQVLGALCAVDHVAHRWSEEDQNLLTDFAAAVMSDFALRMANTVLEAQVQARTRELVVANAELQAAVTQLKHEVSEREAAEAALRVSEERLLFALEGSGAGVWDWDMVTGAMFYATEWYEMLGYVEGEVAPTIAAWNALLHPEDCAIARAGMTHHLAGEAARYMAEYRLRRRDGSYAWVLDRGKVVAMDADGRPLRMVGAMIDITAQRAADAERARLQQRLQQAQQLEEIGRFTSGIAHDFNNMLTAMVGETELATEVADDPAALQDHLGRLTQALDRARSLTRQILTFSRGSSAPVLQRQPLQPLLHEVLDLVMCTVPPTIIVTVASDAGVPPLSFDPAQLHQVMLNLLTNALQAMGDGPGQLTVGYAQCRLTMAEHMGADELAPGRYGVLTVQDTGRGMDGTVLARIFEPFFTTKPTGTGLGLALAHRIIAAHGGAVAATSTVGAGSTFTVYLPLDERRGGGLLLDSETRQTLV